MFCKARKIPGLYPGMIYCALSGLNSRLKGKNDLCISVRPEYYLQHQLHFYIGPFVNTRFQRNFSKA